MSNDTAKTITTNIVPVQGTFEPLPPYECIDLIGPAGTPFFAPTNPNLDGVSITNSTINSTTIGVTTPALAAFTTASSTNQPVGNNDLTTKLYVDSLALGISWKQPVLAATLSNITLSGAQTIDTVAVVAGDRVLVKNQTAQAENGIYIAATGAWSRSPDANDWDELVSALVFVESGTQAGSAWYCPVQAGGTLGVTAITWNNFSVGGVYFAGTGLNLSGGDTFNITNTTVAAGSFGSASAVGTFTVNAQGQLTAASNTNIAIGATQITSGTIDSARLSGSYSGITGVGTLTDLTVSNTITGSISGNAATATTATSATSATTATNLAGGAAGSVPYQSGAGATTFLAAGTNGQVLTIAGGVPSYATPTTGTVTSVSGTGTVSGISLSGTVTSSGNLTLGGTLDLSAPPTIGNTTANTIAGTTVTASTSFASPIFKATNSAGGTLQNASGAAQMQWGSGGGNNLSLEVATNINPANAAVSISPTGTGTVAISPAGALTINPTTASTMNNVAIGSTTAAAAKVTTLDITSTLALAGSTGTAGYVLTSNGALAPTWQVNSNGVTITDDTTTNATRYLTFSELTTGTETTLDVSSTKLQFNPSTGILTSTGLAGALNGTVGATTATTATFTTATVNTLADSQGGVLAPISSVMRNRIINGAMVIDQRNAGASVTPTDGQFCVDRFSAGLTQASKFSFQQVTDAPTGFANSIKVTSLSAYSVLTGDLFEVRQNIEGHNVADLGWGTANAKTVTLSFWVKSSLTGTFGGALSNDGLGRSYPFSYTISAANTWEQKSITVAGDTSGTWLTTNGVGIRVRFSLGAGATYSGTAGAWAGSYFTSATGATSVVGTNGATFYITGVQLEVGTQATSFEYRQYTTELQLCQRYFYMICNGDSQTISVGSYYNASIIATAIQLPVEMRTTPSLFQVSGTDYFRIFRNDTFDTFNSFTGITRGSGRAFALDADSTGASGTAGQSGPMNSNNSLARLGFSAEL
jgi:hypothetical protein